MGISLICMQVKSPMLVAVGMYLPLETTFAIFIGGIIRYFTDSRATHKMYNDWQKVRVENVGVLLASGLIAGEALMGLVFAGFAVGEIFAPAVFPNMSFAVSVIVLCVLG